VDKGSLIGQTLDPSIWMERASLLNMYTLQADPQTTMLVTQQIALNLPPHNLVYDIDV